MLPDTELNHPIDETASVGVYGDIAAGDPIDARQEIKEQFLLPSEWILQRENAFMLEVTGDSVLLIPENTRYESINVKPEQVLINGVVIGML